METQSATMRVPLAIVHHANQYLITEGYENRHGLRATIGSIESKSGLAWILELHRIYKIPANLHLSGTLLEAIAWHQPAFLQKVRKLCEDGLIDFVGSCYGQNIMRFFNYEHNLRQLNEELRLYEIHLGLDPTSIKVFWPPERVWDTRRMAAVLTDARLLNGGYKFFLIDDRILLPLDGNLSPRNEYDRNPRWDPQLFQAYPVDQGHGLIALPIANNLRQNIPPGGEGAWAQLRDQLSWLATLNSDSFAGDVIALYGDDMEKAAGLGAWDKGAPVHFEHLLRWLSESHWIEPVQLRAWCSRSRFAPPKSIEVGTFRELANHFAAGEGYEKWFFDPQWDRYREYFSWAETRVNELSLLGADSTLIELAEKHLMASSWESAWHTPAEGPFGNPEVNGHLSPWIRAVGSHCRHAAVIAEAGYWMHHKDDMAHAYFQDIDSDGEDEVVLKNDKLFAVISPRWGGRLVALFSVEGPHGQLVIGNPSDDWNWMEELNKYMEVPANHPGALTDRGFEHDMHSSQFLTENGATASIELTNKQPHSGALGLKKKISLTQGANALEVQYSLPPNLRSVTVEFALSPDYLSLLRRGRGIFGDFERDGARGCCARQTAVWVKPSMDEPFSWSQPQAGEAGHKLSLRLTASARQFSVAIGVERT